MRRSNLQKRKGISPIIATLLLILIAIAAGVLVYAYVTGYIGSSTQNGGGTVDTLKLDIPPTISSKAGAFPVLAYIRNFGPNPESFNTGFYVSSSSTNLQLGPAVSLVASAGTFTVTGLTLTSSGSNTVTVTPTGTVCTGTGALTASGFGSTTATLGTCAAGAWTAAAGTLTLATGIVETATFSTAYSTQTVTTTSLVVGFSITAGSISVPINAVGTFTLAQSGVQASNPLTSGTSYQFSAHGGDGAVAIGSAISQ